MKRRMRSKNRQKPLPKREASSPVANQMAGAFGEALTAHLAQLAELRERGASEDSLRDSFLRFLRNAFPMLEQADPILLERHIPALRVRGGFADALYGDLIFEFKRRLEDATRAEGREELGRYIENQDHPERYFGILTDAEILEVYALRQGTLSRIDGLQLVPEDAVHAKLWLDCYLFHEKRLTPSARDVALRFGERSPSFWRGFCVLEEMWRDVKSTSPAQTRFTEWQSLLSIVYGSGVGDDGLFLRHTYLALFARVLALVAIERRAPDEAELSGILSGATFERMGFENFVGEDFFTWVGASACARATGTLLRALATRLTAAYDLAAIGEDLLKELYQELVDPQTRRDLGEFYTPDWLAELTLRRAGFPPRSAKNPRDLSLVDPSCGSGTFLFTAVRLLRDHGYTGTKLVDYCAQYLAGVDVHPLAVAIAKTNLILALGEDLRDSTYGKPLTLPVYMADTLLSADAGTTHPEIEIKVDVDEIARRSKKERRRGVPSAFGIPASLADKPELLHPALDSLLEFAAPSIDPKHAREGFRLRLEELGVPAAQWHQWAANLDLMRWLLEAPPTDSVWRFVLKNGYQPELLSRRKYAFVVGNPPWLSYRCIARSEYQERVRELVLHYGLLTKHEGHLFTQMELATLFFAFCADRYLADRGTLAFVMPRSVLTGAKQHSAFGRQYVASSRLVIDCEQVTPLFNVPACALVWRKPSATRSAPSGHDGRRVPTLRLSGELPNRNASLSEASTRLRLSKTAHAGPEATASSPYWAQIINGATIFPRCLWFVRPPPSARTVDRRRPQLETNTDTERQAKKPWKGIHLSGSVESEFLFATLLSDDMLPFGRRRMSLVVLPWKKEEDARLLDVSEAVRLGRPGLADWLRKAEATWAAHAKPNRRVRSIYERLDLGRCLTRQEPTGVIKVIYNAAGTHLCSCVVDARDVAEWSLSGLPVAGFVAENVTYWFETQSPTEAHYLCAVLNAPFVDRAIKPYQTKGSFGAQHGKGERHIHRRPFEVLPIPRFQKDDATHQGLAEASRRCHRVMAEFLADSRAECSSAPIGRLRSQLRSTVLREDLMQIDELVKKMFKRR
jgi:hypothetical protein